MGLWGSFLAHQGRPALKWKHYFPIYERHLSRYVDRPITFIEIGCGEGGSLQLWKSYFGPAARIIGIDINQKCKSYEEDQISVRVGNQSDPVFLGEVVREFGVPDAILDDGSHIMGDQIASFQCLYPRLDRYGVYMVEDVHTSYMGRFGGGLQRPGTFIEVCKGLIDELGAETSGPEGARVTDFTRSTASMHFYDSVVAIERGTSTHKHMLRRGGGLDVTQDQA